MIHINQKQRLKEHRRREYFRRRYLRVKAERQTCPAEPDEPETPEEIEAVEQFLAAPLGLFLQREKAS